jgi:predicted GNAT superfamily acetyltransferase
MSMSASPVTIIPLKDIDALRRIEALQHEIWGAPPLEVVPAHQLLAATGAGGVVLGAFDDDGTLVGFCYGFAGWRDGRPFLYSHMAGVTGGRRLREIGLQIKLAQREAALALGYDHAVWTFDPLQSINARFNLHKLQATADRYYVDYYGEMPDEINRGMGSDRLEVDWALRTPRVEAAARAASARAPAGRAETGHAGERDWTGAPRALGSVPWHGLLGPGDTVLNLATPAIRVEIPTDVAAMRSQDPGLVRAWRVASREVFLRYFGEGYRAADFVLTPGEVLRGDYVLTRGRNED